MDTSTKYDTSLSALRDHVCSKQTRSFPEFKIVLVEVVVQHMQQPILKYGCCTACDICPDIYIHHADKPYYRPIERTKICQLE